MEMEVMDNGILLNHHTTVAHYQILTVLPYLCIQERDNTASLRSALRHPSLRNLVVTPTMTFHSALIASTIS